MNPKVSEYLIKPAIVGGIAAAGSMFFIDGATRVPFFGMDLSAPVAIGGAVAIGNVASSLSHDYPGNDEKMVEWQSASLGPALTGAASVPAANATIGTFTDSTAMLQLFALGAGSQVAGSYVFAAIDPDADRPCAAVYGPVLTGVVSVDSRRAFFARGELARGASPPLFRELREPRAREPRARELRVREREPRRELRVRGPRARARALREPRRELQELQAREPRRERAPRRQGS